MADVTKSKVEEECVSVPALSPAKRKLNSEEKKELDESKKMKTEMPVEEEEALVDGEEEVKLVKSEAGIEVEDDDDEADDEFDEEEEEEEKLNGGLSEIDRKGKGIMREEDEEEDDEDDSSDDDGDDFSDDEIDSDLEDDPLAEVDLDNILPSRTRRRGAAPAGICLSKNEASSQGSSAGKDNTDA